MKELRVQKRVEKQHQEALDRMLKKEKIGLVKKAVFEILLGILLVVASSIAMYYIWAYFYPNDEVIRFLFWYFTVGLVINLLIIASCSNRISKYEERRCKSILINKRRIDRYYKYLIKDLLD